MKKRIAITGASGFIGRGVVIELTNAGYEVVCLTRQINETTDSPHYRWVQIADYTNAKEVAAAIAGADIVIHLADDPNRAAKGSTWQGAGTTTALIEAMRSVGAKRLILASSVYARLDEMGQHSAYGAHKRAIEDVVIKAKDIHTVILRLPQVYGPGGGGGIAMLVNLIQRNVPIPVGRAHAPRSYLALSNLTDLIRVLAGASLQLWARNKGIYEPSDQQLISTRSLTLAIAKTISAQPKIISVPPGVLKFLGHLFRKTDLVSAAFTPLQVASKPNLKKAFNWTPPQCMPGTLEYLSDTEHDSHSHVIAERQIIEQSSEPETTLQRTRIS